MFRMAQGIRGMALLRMAMVRNFACAGIAVVLISCIAAAVSAQQVTSDQTGIAPPADAPPLSITQHYASTAPQPHAAMTLLVDAPPAPGSVGGSVAEQTPPPQTATPAPIGDRVDGPAINTLAAGRAAITVSTLDGRRR